MPKPKSDPKGHSLRIYDNVYDSAAFAALSPYDVMAYLALLRELKGYNNGDLSLPLSRSKKYGIKHHVTLAKSLRALCAVGLIAVTRRGGCTKGGQRLPTLYRLTDRICYPIPAKFLEGQNETNDWRKITTKEQGQKLIQIADMKAKERASNLKPVGHVVTSTVSRHEVVGPITTSSADAASQEEHHPVTYGENSENPIMAHLAREFLNHSKDVCHATADVSPLYIATHGGIGHA